MTHPAAEAAANHVANHVANHSANPAANHSADPEFPVLSSQHHYSGWVIEVRTDEIQMPDGSVGKRDIVGHSGAVVILPLDEQERVITVRQYRAPLGMHLVELPAGLLDIPGELALTAARRELAEETGLAASDWAVLLDVYTSPGMTDEAIRIYLARGLQSVPRDEHFEITGEEVTMTVSAIPLSELVADVLAGRLTNGPAVAGIMAAELNRLTGWGSLRPADAPWPARSELAG